MQRLQGPEASRFLGIGVAQRVPAGSGRLLSVTGQPSARQPNSIWLYSRSLCRAWRALTKRTVPERERITMDWVVTP